MDVIQKLPVSPGPQTPPSSPQLPTYKHTLCSKHVRLLVDLLKAAQAIQTAPAAAGAVQPASTKENPGDKKTSQDRQQSVRPIQTALPNTAPFFDICPAPTLRHHVPTVAV